MAPQTPPTHNTPAQQQDPLLLRLERDAYAPTHTAGRLAVAVACAADPFATPSPPAPVWQPLCDTLEPPRYDARGRENAPRTTCIPAGRYRLVTTYSPRFTPRLHCLVPALCDVPARSAILIHPGNTVADTEGCILVGRRTSGQTGRLAASRAAFDRVQALVAAAYARRRPVWLDIG